MMPHSVNADSIGHSTPHRMPSDWILVLLSLIIQLVAAYLFGHMYDIRIFMATGYLAGTGQNPYVPQDLSHIFHNPSFQGITTIGYPPPWALILGFIYLFSYRLIPNLLVYNLALKLPIIAANLCLAFLVADILTKFNVSRHKIRAAWLFFLFNPFLILTSSAWGQFDSVVALFSLLAILLLFKKNYIISAIFLALAISLKPTALPLFSAAYIFFHKRPISEKVKFGGVFFPSMLVLNVLPFWIFHWDPTIILNNWNAHFTVGGGISYMTFLELTRDSYTMPGNWWLIGLLWIPIQMIAAIVIRPEIKGFPDLISLSAAMIMIFFLSLAWLSEQNIILLLPFVVILASLGIIRKGFLTATWVLPLIFGIFNTSFAQLLFPSMPAIMTKLLQLAHDYSIPRLIAKIMIVIPWLVTGWMLVVACLKQPLANPSTDQQEGSS